MPIGTITGFFIGTFIIGILLAVANNAFYQQRDKNTRFVQQLMWMLGWGFMIVSACALLGTIIELIVR